MSLPRFPRLEEVLGARLDALDENHLRSIVERADTNPVHEDADLDFKRELYANSDDGKRSLAADVAAMANTRGGAILMGVDENASGAAGSLTPVELSDAEVRRIHQVVAGLVAPLPPIHLRPVRVGNDPARGALILAVPASSWAPHAIRVNDALRYYRRDGARNRLLAENEVAIAYRDRARAAEAQLDRLGRVDEEGRAVLDPDGVWLTLSMVPNVAGSMPIQHRTRVGLEDWARRFSGGHVGDGPLDRHAVVGVAVRRLTLRSRHGAIVQRAYAELYDDGSGFAAREIFRRLGPSPEMERRLIADETLVLTMSGLLTMLSDHALRNAGASGDCAVRSSLHGNQQTRGQFAPPLALGHYRHFGTPDEWSDTRHIMSLVQSDRTMNVEAIATNNIERMLATRELLSEHFQAFGLAEVPQIDALGRLRRPYWENGTVPTGWNGRVGVSETNERLGEGDGA